MTTDDRLIYRNWILYRRILCESNDEKSIDGSLKIPVARLDLLPSIFSTFHLSLSLSLDFFRRFPSPRFERGNEWNR